MGASVVVFGDHEHWRVFRLGRELADRRKPDRGEVFALIEAFRGFIAGLSNGCPTRLYFEMMLAAREYYHELREQARLRPPPLYAWDLTECSEKTALWRAVQIERFWRRLAGDNRTSFLDLRRDLEVDRELALIDIDPY